MTSLPMGGLVGPVTSEQLVLVYRRAADMLDQFGWMRGQNVGANNERCLGAAVNEAAGRPHNNPSHDLFIPLARWLVDNRKDQIVQALRNIQYTPADPMFARTMAKSFVMSSGGVSALRTVQRWNDDVEDPESSMAYARPARTRDAVTAVLRQVAVEVGESARE